MKARLLFILLFLGGVVFFGCKKVKPIHEPNMVIKQDSFQRIMDSINLISLESTLVGTYIVSGTYEYVGPRCYDSSGYNRDTLTITKYGASFLIISLHVKESSLFNYNPPPLSPGAMNGPYLTSLSTDYYYDLNYSGIPANGPEEDLLSFPKDNIDSVFLTSFINGSHECYAYIYLSGVKIH